MRHRSVCARGEGDLDDLVLPADEPLPAALHQGLGTGHVAAFGAAVRVPMEARVDGGRGVRGSCRTAPRLGLDVALGLSAVLYLLARVLADEHDGQRVWRQRRGRSDRQAEAAT